MKTPTTRPVASELSIHPAIGPARMRPLAIEYVIIPGGETDEFDLPQFVRVLVERIETLSEGLDFGWLFQV
ncbi:hypothetical protein ACETU7_21470 [Rhodococcus sp. 3Y1]